MSAGDKFCKDCLHCVRADYKDEASQLQYAKCGNPEIMAAYSRNSIAAHPEYLVTGVPQMPYAAHARMPSSDGCGQEGRMFEPKTQAAICPVCRSPHPADVACKPLEKSDNGYTLTRRE